MILRTFFIVSLFMYTLYAYSSKAINAYAVAVYDANMNEENIQGVRKTKKDYNGLTYTKIYAFGDFFHMQPHAQIGSSLGILVRKRPIVKNGLHIGYEMIFKHLTVRSGYLEVYIGNELFDRSLYVK
ncbi:hypothetical protein [Candidatus Marinarcus aquaticus]|uniref:Uncharacterized protein n=1 Tax=Candidatus Marinarcus aquaticus TaxID=2044504 RepID=A0A4Q0XT80_9BACT|nr:hypothetical protein [Candidatus Marinarcus aquaticus]RXJ57621.1 hypothetical protein CRV04_07360 [Candidatus Marinarcus aquaticus]